MHRFGRGKSGLVPLATLVLAGIIRLMAVLPQAPSRRPSRNLFHGTMERMPMMRILDLTYGLSPHLGRMLVKLWYRYLTHLDKHAEMMFMNYGYAELDAAGTRLALRPEDESNRYSIQLYHHVASGVDLTDRDVLEVGCGRGGGASYIARYLHPRSVTGIDVAPNAVDFCKRHYAVDGLNFACGDAVALPFPDNSYDVVVSVESSHCYSPVRNFLAETLRVLRPGGYLLLADRRDLRGVDTLRTLLVRSGYQIIGEQLITPNILRALDMDAHRRITLMNHGVPKFWRKMFKQFAATPGTSLYESFRNRRWEYVSYVARAPARPDRRPA
jgi:SAM-dependent methyltransferase